MMKNFIFGISTLAIIMHITPAVATPGESVLVGNAHPISGLIADWQQFRAKILAMTSKFDHDDALHAGQPSRLTSRLVGTWRTTDRQHDGYTMQRVLQLKRNHHFSYRYRVQAGASEDNWRYSGRWELRNGILMLLIDRSDYPGKPEHQVQFLRLLQLGDSKLVYVSPGSDTRLAMSRIQP